VSRADGITSPSLLTLIVILGAQQEESRLLRRVLENKDPIESANLCRERNVAGNMHEPLAVNSPANKIVWPQFQLTASCS
jgi:hypothetical protein